MPPWGRPPRGMDVRSRREWEQQMRDWEDSGRFEELDSDDEDVVELSPKGPPGYSRSANRDVNFDLAYGEDYEDERFYEEGSEMQIAIRQKEEELAEQAMRRIHRARLQGESSVKLTRAELDALEKQRAMGQLVSTKPGRSTGAQPSQVGPRGRNNNTAQAKKKKSSALASKGKASKPAGNHVSTPVSDREEYPLPPAGYLPALQTSPKGKRGNARPDSRGRQQPSPNSSPYDYDPRLIPQSEFYPPSPSRASPTRSLPDDPDWIPRSRSSSVQYQHGGPDPFMYQVSGRRSATGPPQVAYSQIWRQAPNAGRVPSDPSLPRRSSSGLGKEVHDDSTGEEDEDDEDDEDEDEDESDEGVRVDALPEPAATRGRAPPSGRAAAVRPRRSGRRS